MALNTVTSSDKKFFCRNWGTDDGGLNQVGLQGESLNSSRVAILEGVRP